MQELYRGEVEPIGWRWKPSTARDVASLVKPCPRVATLAGRPPRCLRARPEHRFTALGDRSRLPPRLAIDQAGTIGVGVVRGAVRSHVGVSERTKVLRPRHRTVISPRFPKLPVVQGGRAAGCGAICELRTRLLRGSGTGAPRALRQRDPCPHLSGQFAMHIAQVDPTASARDSADCQIELAVVGGQQ